MSLPLINGNSFNWAQVRIDLGGIQLYGVTAINYDQEQEKPNQFGVGELPVERGRGARDATADMTISQVDLEIMRDNAPNGQLLDLAAFDVIVSYDNGQRVVTHVLKNCEFTSDGGGGAQGDTQLTKQMNLSPSHIKYR